MIVKDFVIENTGGGIYVAWGSFENGNYFAIGDELLMIYDEDEFVAMDSSEYQKDSYTWQLKHTIDSCSNDDKMYLDVLKQIYDRCSEKDKINFHSLFIDFEDNE